MAENYDGTKTVPSTPIQATNLVVAITNSHKKRKRVGNRDNNNDNVDNDIVGIEDPPVIATRRSTRRRSSEDGRIVKTPNQPTSIMNRDNNNDNVDNDIVGIEDPPVIATRRSTRRRSSEDGRIVKTPNQPTSIMNRDNNNDNVDNDIVGIEDPPVIATRRSTRRRSSEDGRIVKTPNQPTSIRNSARNPHQGGFRQMGSWYSRYNGGQHSTGIVTVGSSINHDDRSTMNTTSGMDTLDTPGVVSLSDVVCTPGGKLLMTPQSFFPMATSGSSSTPVLPNWAGQCGAWKGTAGTPTGKEGGCQSMTP